MASNNNSNQVDDQSKVTFQFCSECSNLLYPQEVFDDSEGGKLVYQCRTCTHDAEAASACIYRNELNSTVAATAGNIHDIGSDPTLPRATVDCPRCGEKEPVYFQSQQRTAETGMGLYYVCTNATCGNVWQTTSSESRSR